MSGAATDCGVPLPYTCVWEFRVRAGSEADFEQHYRADGTWATLFREAPGYIETVLLKDRSKPNRYLTIDRWQSEEAFRAFRENFSGQYDALDRLCEGLTTSERSLGAFTG